jgi:hypothetical protein
LNACSKVEAVERLRHESLGGQTEAAVKSDFLFNKLTSPANHMLKKTEDTQKLQVHVLRAVLNITLGP